MFEGMTYLTYFHLHANTVEEVRGACKGLKSLTTGYEEKQTEEDSR